MNSFTSGLTSLFTGMAGYSSVDDRAATAEQEKWTQRRLAQSLDALSTHLTYYCEVVDKVSREFRDGLGEEDLRLELGLEKMEQRKAKALRSIVECENLRRSLWMGFWMEIIDEDASGLYTPLPVTLEEIEELVESGAVRLKKLNASNDKLRRECAMLTAQLCSKKGALPAEISVACE